MSAMLVVQGPADGALKMISSTVLAVRTDREAPRSWSLPFEILRNMQRECIESEIGRPKVRRLGELVRDKARSLGTYFGTCVRGTLGGGK